MYTEFYGLTSRPFQLTPDARFFFESSVHRQAMAYLVYGLHHAEGFIVITGEVGAGKTILVDNLLSSINASEFVTAKIVTTQLAGDDLLHMVAAGFGIDQDDLAKASLLRRISEFLMVQHRSGRRALLIVDEVQNLSFEALEELRMLSNIIIDNMMALQSFLVGQPQFRKILGSPELEQLRQRVTAAYHLGPLNEAETRAYIEHRLHRAGWKADPHLTDDCFSAIYNNSGGVPRRINALCSRLFLYGFIEGLHTFSGSAAEKVALDLRKEVAVVTVAPTNAADPSASSLLSQVEDRIARLEGGFDRHQRVIRRAIAVAANYLLDETP